MKKAVLFVVLSAMAHVVWAAEPFYVHQQVGFSPKSQQGSALTGPQKADLEACVQFAKAEQERAQSARSRGGMGDVFGVSVSNCLADPETGKGWRALSKVGGNWQEISVQQAIRKFMGLE
jgi:hypothetical protein